MIEYYSKNNLQSIYKPTQSSGMMNADVHRQDGTMNLVARSILTFSL